MYTHSNGEKGGIKGDSYVTLLEMYVPVLYFKHISYHYKSNNEGWVESYLFFFKVKWQITIICIAKVAVFAFFSSFPNMTYF